MILYTVRTRGICHTWKTDDTMMMNNNVVRALHCTLPYKAMALHAYSGLYGASKVVVSGRSTEPKSKLFLWIRRENRKLLRDGCPSHFFSFLFFLLPSIFSFALRSVCCLCLRSAVCGLLSGPCCLSARARIGFIG